MAIKEDTEAIKQDTAAIVIDIPILQADIVVIKEIQVLQQNNEKHDQTLRWLSTTNFPAQQHDIISRRENNTGQWFLESYEFQHWLQSTIPSKPLFCPGIPGAGKTMMAAIAINHLCTAFTNDKNIGIAYVYCNYKEHGSQSAQGCLAALLKQLVQSRPDIAQPVQLLYSKHAGRQTRPLIEETFNTLRSICTVYLRVFIVLDALDEFTNSNNERGKLIDLLSSLEVETNIKLMMTSRFIPDIEREYQSAIKLEIRASDQDVRKYITGQLPRLPKCIQNDNGLKTEIQNKITERVDGMWVMCD
jgi:hypothetical protein